MVSKIPTMWCYSFVLLAAEKKKKKLKKSFHLLLISWDKALNGLPVIASSGFTCRQHSFALFSLGRVTENGITRLLFSKPQSHKICYHVIRIFNRRLNSTVREVVLLGFQNLRSLWQLLMIHVPIYSWSTMGGLFVFKNLFIKFYWNLRLKQ